MRALRRTARFMRSEAGNLPAYVAVAIAAFATLAVLAVQSGDAQRQTASAERPGRIVVGKASVPCRKPEVVTLFGARGCADGVARDSIVFLRARERDE